MTGIKQRDELQSTIWKIANEVRGAVDGWDLSNLSWELFFIGLSVKTLPVTLKAAMTVSIMPICRTMLSPLR